MSIFQATSERITFDKLKKGIREDDFMVVEEMSKTGPSAYTVGLIAQDRADIVVPFWHASFLALVKEIPHRMQTGDIQISRPFTSHRATMRGAPMTRLNLAVIPLREQTRERFAAPWLTIFSRPEPDLNKFSMRIPEGMNVVELVFANANNEILQLKG